MNCTAHSTPRADPLRWLLVAKATLAMAKGQADPRGTGAVLKCYRAAD